MFSAARVGDALCHGGLIVTGSGDVFTNQRPASLVGGSAAGCGFHCVQVVAIGSGSVFINNVPAARVASVTSCGAAVVTGSGDVFVGD